MRRCDADPARPDVRAPGPEARSGLMRVGLLDGAQRDRRPATLDELLARARLAESLGLRSVWFSNIFGHDAMTVAALAARVTDRIEVGTAITPTYPRHPYAMAQQAASTAAAARGRFTLGVGPSHRVVVEDMWGLSYERAYAHTGEYLSVLVPLLRTGKVEHAGTRFTVRAHLTSTDGLPVPVLLSGLGPKMLALAGTLAAGTITWMVGASTTPGSTHAFARWWRSGHGCRRLCRCPSSVRRDEADRSLQRDGRWGCPGLSGGQARRLSTDVDRTREGDLRAGGRAAARKSHGHAPRRHHLRRRRRRDGDGICLDPR